MNVNINAKQISDFARPYVQTLSARLPHQARNFGVNLIGEECYATLLEDVDFAVGRCTKLAISKALGLGIVGAGSIVKLPQIFKLIGSKSSRGVSFFSYLLETIAYGIGLAYNARQGFAFSTYGETALIAIQNMIVLILLLHYAGRQPAAAALVAVIAGLGWTLFARTDIVTKDVLSLLQTLTVPISLLAKVPQIRQIARSKTTGQLSAFSVFTYLFGSIARVFTTLQETNDPILLAGFAGAAVLNGILALQMLRYWRSK